MESRAPASKWAIFGKQAIWDEPYALFSSQTITALVVIGYLVWILPTHLFKSLCDGEQREGKENKKEKMEERES